MKKICLLFSSVLLVSCYIRPISDETSETNYMIAVCEVLTETGTKIQVFDDRDDAIQSVTVLRQTVKIRWNPSGIQLHSLENCTFNHYW